MIGMVWKPQVEIKTDSRIHFCLNIHKLGRYSLVCVKNDLAFWGEIAMPPLVLDLKIILR